MGKGRVWRLTGAIVALGRGEGRAGGLQAALGRGPEGAGRGEDLTSSQRHGRGRMLNLKGS